MSYNPFLRSRPRSLISGYHDTAISVEPKTKEGLYICNSNDATISIDRKCAKVGIEACSNLRVYFNSFVMTEMLEIVSSENIDIYISEGVSLRTIAVDMCRNVNVHVLNAGDQLYKIYYHQSSDTKIIKHGGGTLINVDLDVVAINNEKQLVQFVCKVNDDGEVEIDPVVREAKGYPTTSKELEAHHANEIILLRHFRDQLYLLDGLVNMACSSEESTPSTSPP